MAISKDSDGLRTINASPLLTDCSFVGAIYVSFNMHLSFALLTALPLGALAHGGAVLRSVPQHQPEVPAWAKECNGKCTFTKTSTRTVWTTKKITSQHRPATTTKVILQTSTSTSTLAQDTSVFSTTEAPATSTIPAPAGFTPVKSVFPGGSTPKRSLEQRKQSDNRKPNVQANWREIKKCTATKYRTVYETKRKTRTSTVWRPVSTVVRKSTSTVTTVTSVLPTPASSTITILTTSTIPSTSTSATTTTVTSTSTTTELSGPTPTFYAACADDNILSNVNGQYVDTLYYGPPGGSAMLGQFRTAYECCVACLNTPNCRGAGWISSSVCIGSTSGTGAATCDGSVIGASFGATSTNNVGWTVSNSGCGQWGRR
ncbi:uncharacterized protein CC84DRAFT_123378 [Paraphaeosphaeria sporulosa]|uniref:Apple domain-containing protein n=1 Tax=Paraphaeosphaeria sporulosa TaxID=1460663 RepID=A0A177CY17_9PLEO|nr:uncharacterized protein CC84DRAFT_123378 [Paraphaeosphaeria sporulosa]OAG12455.1 hypothetical protein CC84DRAFT_123378 [Paraphaeosphaeria sporulosa]